MTASNTVTPPTTPAPEHPQHRPPARRTKVVIAAAVAVVAAISVVVAVRSRSDDLAPLTAAPAAAPTVVDGEAAGAPWSDLRSMVDAAEATSELGPYIVDPAVLVTARDVEPPVAAAGVAGAVPAWFPVVDGAVQLSAHFSAKAVEADESPRDVDDTEMYSAYVDHDVTQRSVFSTVLEPDAVVAAITDAVGDVWTEFDTDASTEWEDAAAEAWREQDGIAASARLRIGVSRLEGTDLMIVEVTTSYGDITPIDAPLPALDGSSLELLELAGSEGWLLAQWNQSVGLLYDLATYHRDERIAWTVGEAPDEAADAVVARIGLPITGDADAESALLRYPDGQVAVGIPDDDRLEWASSSTVRDPIEPGPLTVTEHGSPFVTVDVVARETTAGLHPRPVVDAIAEFDQLGMIAIDGAVAVYSDSGVTADDGGVYDARASQLAVVDTELSADEVTERIVSTLNSAGVELTPTTDGTFYVDDGVRLESSYSRPIGQPWYQIEVGMSREHPGLLAVWIDVMTDVAGPIPVEPTMAADYFAETIGVGDDQGWELTRWYVVEGELVDGTASMFRGELDWRAAERGPDGLDSVVDDVADLTELEPDENSAHGYWFEGVDDWAVSLTWGDTYEPVRIGWEGRGIEPPAG